MSEGSVILPHPIDPVMFFAQRFNITTKTTKVLTKKKNFREEHHFLFAKTFIPAGRKLSNLLLCLLPDQPNKKFAESLEFILDFGSLTGVVWLD